MKVLKRKILFTLASEVDFFIKSEGFEYKPYGFIYWRLGDYQKSSIRDAVLQLVESGEIDKITRNGTPLFRLTSQGRDRLLSFFPISIGQRKVWDRIWRIAIISSKLKVQNSKLIRNLRRGLRKLGFKKLSRGVYLTPLPISAKLREFLLENNLTAQIAVIESRKLLVGDDKQLAKQIWQLDSLVESYSQFVNRVKNLLSFFKKQKGLSKKEKKQFSFILNILFSLLETDPGLPKKLLPDDWPADVAREQFLKLALKIKVLENEQKLS